MDDLPDNAPSPFQKSVRRGPFTSYNGPWYHWAEAGAFRHGIRLQARHANSRGITHGGFLSLFADGLLATAVFRSGVARSVTAQLITDFLEPAQTGAWLQGTAWVTRKTRSLVFVEGRAWCGEAKPMPENDYIFTAKAIFAVK